jgi:hypothetical protein
MQQRIALGLVAVVALHSSTKAQTFTTIVRTGDSIAGVGNVLGTNGLAVDNQGQVLVHVITDNPNPSLNAAIVDATHAPLLKEGDAVSQPPGATIESFNAIVATSSGGVPAFYLELAGTAGTQDNTGIYVGFPPVQVVRESLPCTASGIAAGSSFSLLLAPKINDSQQVCFHAVIDDPNIPGANNFPALFTIDTSSGNQTLIAKRDDILPGQTWGIWNLEWDSLRLGFNNAGQVLFRAQTYDNPNVQNVIYLDSTLIAQTGNTSPFGGAYVSFYEVDLTDNGSNAFKCAFGSFMDGIVQDGAGFVQTGDGFPSIDPFAISELYEPHLGDDGTVIWLGLWNLPGGGQGRGLFKDYSLIVEEGQTQLNGQVVTNVFPAGAYHRSLSKSGQYFAFAVTLADGSNGAYLVNLWQ